jgi:hypothetical protein
LARATIFDLWKNPSGFLRASNRDKKLANERDRVARAERLSVEAVQFWTEKVNLAAAHVLPGQSLCATGPWSAVLDDVLKDPPFIGKPGWRPAPYFTFFEALVDIAQPGWPEPRADLIQFALAVLEADVMLFRSGYAKRHLIRRLQQSPLADADVLRVQALLERAVLQGTGLEEARAYRKLAAHLAVAGRLPGFEDWLEAQAEGAVLTLSDAHWPIMDWLEDKEDKVAQMFSRVADYGEHTFGLTYPAMDQMVPAGDLRKGLRQRQARMAYRMIAAIKGRRMSLPPAMRRAGGQG